MLVSSNQHLSGATAERNSLSLFCRNYAMFGFMVTEVNTIAVFSFMVRRQQILFTGQFFDCLYMLYQLKRLYTSK
jgi:hypothetical protein